MKIKDKLIACSFIISSLLSAIFFMLFLFLDATNNTHGIGPNLKIDWVAAGCSLLSNLTTMALGVIAILQNNTANKQNERLARISEAQLEGALISDNYPQIKFRKKQIVKYAKNIFEFSFVDIRNTPLKEAYIQDVKLIPYSEPYKIDEEKKPIVIQKGVEHVQLEYTPFSNEEDERDGFYFMDITATPDIFFEHEHYRLEFDLAIISTIGVATVYSYKLLIKRTNEERKEKGRKYIEVYHQFCNTKHILSEQKAKKSKKVLFR